MKSIWIVLKNEFLKRIKTRAFILTTLLAPIALIAFFAIVAYASISALESGNRTVAVIDDTGVLAERKIGRAHV